MKSTNLTPEMFRRIAEKYFCTPKLISTSHGICYNLKMEFPLHPVDLIYQEMDHLMCQIGYDCGYFSYDGMSGWSARANMFLFMAEMLEDGTLQSMTD